MCKGLFLLFLVQQQYSVERSKVVFVQFTFIWLLHMLWLSILIWPLLSLHHVFTRNIVNLSIITLPSWRYLQPAELFITWCLTRRSIFWFQIFKNYFKMQVFCICFRDWGGVNKFYIIYMQKLVWVWDPQQN